MFFRSIILTVSRVAEPSPLSFEWPGPSLPARADFVEALRKMMATADSPSLGAQGFATLALTTDSSVLRREVEGKGQTVAAVAQDLWIWAALGAVG